MLCRDLCESSVQPRCTSFCFLKKKFLLPFLPLEEEENEKEKSGCIPKVLTKAQVWEFEGFPLLESVCMCWKKMMPINNYPFPASHGLKSLQFSQAASYQTFTQKRKDLLGCDWTWAMLLLRGLCPWGLRAARKGLWAMRWQMELHSCSFMLQQSFVLGCWYFPATRLKPQQLSCEYSSPFFFVNAVWSNWRAGDVLNNLSSWEMMTLDLFNQILSRLRVKIAELVSHKELCCSLGSNPSPETRRLWQDILHSSARGITARSFNCNSSIYQAAQLSGGWREGKGNDSVSCHESLTTWGLLLLLHVSLKALLKGKHNHNGGEKRGLKN